MAPVIFAPSSFSTSNAVPVCVSPSRIASKGPDQDPVTSAGPYQGRIEDQQKCAHVASSYRIRTMVPYYDERYEKGSHSG